MVLRSISLLIFLLLFAGAATAQHAGEVYLFCSFRNNGQDGLHLAYSKDGYVFHPLRQDSSFLRPKAGKDKLMRDPCIIRGGDGLFHMVWTVSWNEKSIGYATSPDLTHWSAQQSLRVMAREDSALNCWAPEVFYDPKSGQYMIFWATTIPGRFQASDTSGDGRYNHRIYYTLTKDFTSFIPTRLLYNRGFSVIDATIVSNGKEYLMFLKDETKRPTPKKNICIARSKKLWGPFSGPSKPIMQGYWAEGPTVLHRGSEWIVYFDRYTQHRYGAVRSNDLEHWEDISDQVHFPAGTRHGSVFSVTASEFQQYFGFLP
jgi:beta-xylosidase